MVRLLGALLLSGGTTLLGFLAAARLNRRVGALRAFLGALELLERELSFRLTPMPALLAILAQRSPAPVDAFFTRCLQSMDGLGEKTLAQIWDEALVAVPMDLGKEAGQILRELGSVLGRYDGQGQRESLNLAQIRLEQCLLAAGEERSRMGRVYRSLGLTLGALLVILLL